jgi:hypothetical protein
MVAVGFLEKRLSRMHSGSAELPDNYGDGLPLSMLFLLSALFIENGSFWETGGG